MPQLNVLFWNVQRKDLTKQLVSLADSRNVDILILAENPVPSEQLVLALDRHGLLYHRNHPLSKPGKITIITRFNHDLIYPIQEGPRYTTRRVRLPTGDEFLLTALHLVDKGNYTPESQSASASLMADILAKIEVRHANNCHLVLGDFNMNPFEPGMVKANGFHGTMSSEVAQQGSRIVQKEEYSYFYNPVWSLFGDLNKDVSGTFYYRRAELVCYEWNLFDQVLLRPGMIRNFVKSSLEIVQHDGTNTLTTARNTPDKKLYSDHLPLFFTLKF